MRPARTGTIVEVIIALGILIVAAGIGVAISLLAGLLRGSLAG